MQNGIECFCGDIQPTASLYRPGECSTKCPGNENEKCGGSSWRMSVSSVESDVSGKCTLFEKNNIANLFLAVYSIYN